MTHKAFEVIGERIFFDRILHEAELEMLREDIKKKSIDYLEKILETGRERKEGIFQRNRIIGRLNFIEPLYVASEELSIHGVEIDKRVNQENPILNVYYGINTKDLIYLGTTEKNIYLFEMGLYKIDADFITDINPKFIDYIEPLKKAGFKIE